MCRIAAQALEPIAPGISLTTSYTGSSGPMAPLFMSMTSIAGRSPNCACGLGRVGLRLASIFLSFSDRKSSQTGILPPPALESP